MRVPTALLASVLALAGCEHLGQGEGGADGGARSDGPTPSADAGAVGDGCGREASSGVELCASVSTCPGVIVDTRAMPSCGFRVRGAAVDLVCACGTSVCPMGLFSTCSEARTLLETQTEQGVCVQLVEGRCIEVAAPDPRNGTRPCDRDCLADCGGGAGCASVCNCD